MPILDATLDEQSKFGQIFKVGTFLVFYSFPFIKNNLFPLSLRDVPFNLEFFRIPS